MHVWSDLSIMLSTVLWEIVAALMALKRKKRLEKQLQQIDGTLSTIEFQREALENANTNTEVLKNMSYAAKALKSAHQQLWVHHWTWVSTIYLAGVYRNNIILFISLRRQLKNYQVLEPISQHLQNHPILSPYQDPEPHTWILCGALCTTSNFPVCPAQKFQRER